MLFTISKASDRRFDVRKPPIGELENGTPVQVQLWRPFKVEYAAKTGREGQWEDHWSIEIEKKDLPDFLMGLMKESRIILGKAPFEDYDGGILIYDGYIE